ANRLRLLSLPDDIQDGLLHKKITERHARSLMTLKTTEEQVEYYEKVIEQGLTVRELDDLIKSDYAKPVEKKQRKKPKLVSKDRSEEHTSELQSRFDLVCRLLLEKKKRK